MDSAELGSGRRRTILVCSCERSMPAYGDPAYGDHVARGCEDARIVSGDWFCGAELERVRGLLEGDGPVTVGCTQQAPLFREIAEEPGYAISEVRQSGKEVVRTCR